ncbi:Bacterial alpha-L-rhamnosidase [Mucilaginibacter corticis]|uniref:alpha-L-rhamnosidase n=1 Tax=Mucilaginibacter corticis TaxID=2597670 RepID=A0A556MBE9_9SPHI|nr:glycoside hydrolase family 78 protein [Mucilaginibacter corticis]TSJ37216.1 Bacterial alpha-L-rhamnosidase [Mucilaginibacter corticis]
MNQLLPANLSFKKGITCLLISAASILCFTTAKAVTKIDGLKCEYLVNPLGIDAIHPRFTWMMNDTRNGALQTAYEVFVGTDSAAVANSEGSVWDSNKTESSSSLVTYNGKTLQPFTKYYWRVTVWDDANKITQSSVASFETGMVEKSNWKGTWISDNKGPEVKPAPYFRNVFNFGKKVKSARAYIAVAGLYELYINGEKVGNHRLDPMYTRFDRRTLYVTYDVTSQLQAGKNAIGVLLGNGWYNMQSTAVWDFHKAPWRNRPAFCLDLRVTYEDGTVETITSDRSWKSSSSPIVFNSIYTAEHYDARKEQPGWNTVNFDDKGWKGVIIRPAPSANIVSQAMQPIRAIETINSVDMKKIDDHTYLFNIGRTIAGVSKITVKGDSGTVIRLKHTEKLDKNGRADMSNIDVHYRPTDDTDPFQTDIFTLSGKGEETFMPRFNYKGFQYVEVTSSKPITLTKESLTGYFMHSDVAVLGDVSSSNTTLNKIWAATNASYLSNFFGYPTDCPQREKNGWTGDAHIASETGLYGFDGITIYEKWMADHRDEQQPNGVLSSIIPSNGWGYEWGNGPDWTSTVAIIPWNLYQFYGDSKTLSDNYDAIKRYVNHIDDQYPSGLTTWGLGDWVPVKSVSPVEFVSTIYYYTDVNILAKAAKLFGKADDEQKYTALALKIKNAINAKYLNTATGIYDKGYQTELSMPLYWGIVPDELKAKVAANLAERVKQDNNHLDAGILGAKAILGALSDNGHADVAYAIASQETYPSWGWWIKNGATTLYENWDVFAKSDLSLNHIMFGEIGAWYYKGIGGINIDPANPGFKNVRLTPNFVAGLDHFESSHIGPYGKIVSNWKRKGKTVVYSVVIPANSTGTVVLPSDKKAYLNGKEVAMGDGLKVASGSYEFILK